MGNSSQTDTAQKFSSPPTDSACVGHAGLPGLVGAAILAKALVPRADQPASRLTFEELLHAEWLTAQWSHLALHEPG